MLNSSFLSPRTINKSNMNYEEIIEEVKKEMVLKEKWLTDWLMHIPRNPRGLGILEQATIDGKPLSSTLSSEAPKQIANRNVMKYEVWAEGFLDQGMEGIPQKVQFIGFGYGKSFAEAASNCIKEKWGEEEWKRYFHIDGEGNPRAWVRLFDNEADARKSFG